MTLVLAHTADWLLTWLLHATVACGLALLAGRLPVADPRSRDLLWKTALVLPLATSLVSVTISPIARGSVDVAAVARRYMPTPPRSARVSVRTTGAADVATIHVRDDTAQALRYTVLATILLPAVVATTRLARRRRRCWNELRLRRAIDARELGIDVRALSLGRETVRLSVSPYVESAAAVGRREICVSDALTALGPLERDAVIAHEIAHLARRDLAWTAFADGVGCVLAAQPFVRMVARRFRGDAEFICDDIAVSRTGDVRAYVRTLIFFARPYDGSAAAPAYGSSPILERAERILGSSAARGRVGSRVVATLVAMMIFGGLLTLPRLRTGDANRSIRTHVSKQPLSSSFGKQITLTVDVR